MSLKRLLSRTEEAVTRLLAAYGVPGDVFAIPSCLIVTVCPEGEEPMTRMRRIGQRNHDSSVEYDGYRSADRPRSADSGGRRD